MGKQVINTIHVHFQSLQCKILKLDYKNNHIDDYSPIAHSLVTGTLVFLDSRETTQVSQSQQDLCSTFRVFDSHYDIIRNPQQTNERIHLSNE